MLPDGAYKKYTDNVLHWVANADIAAGQLLQHPTGKVGVLNNDAATGELTALDIAAQVEATNSGVAFSAGDAVGWNGTTRQAVIGGGGDFDAGKAVFDAATDEKVLILLNA